MVWFHCWTINLHDILLLASPSTTFLIHQVSSCFATPCKQPSLLRRPVLPAAQPTSAHSGVFARLQWSVPSLCNTYKPLLRQMLSCPVRCLRCLARIVPHNLCTGSRRWLYVETLLHASAASPSALSPSEPFFSNPRWVLPHCRCHSENCDAEYFLALDLVQPSCILLRLQQGRH